MPSVAVSNALSKECGSCDGRVVKALDLKSNGVSPRRFEPCSQRFLFLKVFLFGTKKGKKEGLVVLDRDGLCP